MAKEKTFQDFKTMVSETKLSYLNQKIDNNFNYTFKETELGDGHHFFMICNIHNATKIIYIEEYKTIVCKEISMSEVRLLTDMVKDL